MRNKEKVCYLIIKEINNMNQKTLFNHFPVIEDPRDIRGKKHKFKRRKILFSEIKKD